MIQFNHVFLLAVFPPSTCANPNTCGAYVHTVKLQKINMKQEKGIKKYHPTPLFSKLQLLPEESFHMPNSATTSHNACPGRWEGPLPILNQQGRIFLPHGTLQTAASLVPRNRAPAVTNSPSTPNAPSLIIRTITHEPITIITTRHRRSLKKLEPARTPLWLQCRERVTWFLAGGGLGFGWWGSELLDGLDRLGL